METEEFMEISISPRRRRPLISVQKIYELALLLLPHFSPGESNLCSISFPLLFLSPAKRSLPLIFMVLSPEAVAAAADNTLLPLSGGGAGGWP